MRAEALVISVSSVGHCESRLNSVAQSNYIVAWKSVPVKALYLKLQFT